MTQSRISIECVQEYSLDIFDGVTKLIPKIGNNYILPSESDVKEIINDHGSHLFLARDNENGEIVGMVTLITYRIPYIRKAILEDLVVDENYRGYGIGTLLLDSAKECAVNENAAYIDITSRPSREAANLFYTKYGFEKRETNVYRLKVTSS